MCFRERKIQRAAKAALTKVTKISIRKALWRLLSRLLSLYPELIFVPLCLCVYNLQLSTFNLQSSKSEPKALNLCQSVLICGL